MSASVWDRVVRNPKCTGSRAGRARARVSARRSCGSQDPERDCVSGTLRIFGCGCVPDGRCVCSLREVLGVSFFLGVSDGQGPQEDHHSPIRIDQKETSPALRLLLRADWGHSGFLCLKGEAVCPTSGLHTCGLAAFRSLYPSMAGTAPQSSPL